MPEQRVTTDLAPHIQVTACAGNLVVKSWRETAVSLQGDAITLTENRPDHLSLHSEADLYLAVPPQSSLTLGTINGRVTLKHIRGGIVIDSVSGDLTLGNLAAVTIGHAAQVVNAENIDSRLVIEQAGGPVTLRSVAGVQISHAAAVTIRYANGHVHLEQVDGRLELRTINGDIYVAHAGSDAILENLGGQTELAEVAGDIWLVGGLRAGQHALTGQQNIYVYWPPTAPLNLVAYGRQVDHQLPLENARESSEHELTHLTGRIEEGQTQLRLKAGGRVALKPLSGEPQFSPAEFLFDPPPATPASADAPDALAQLLAALATELPATTLTQLQAIDLEARLRNLLAAAPAAKPLPPPANPETQTHILQLLKDDQLSVAQAQLLLAALKE